MKLIRVLGVFVLLITITTLTAFAEEGGITAPADPMQNENSAQWAWGEVINLDSQAKTLTLKYLDYETDQEKELPLSVDEKTTYENIKSFDEIKIKDTLSVDYAAGPEDKYIAKNISLENPDALPAAPSQPDADTSETDVPVETSAPSAAVESQAQ